MYSVASFDDAKRLADRVNEHLAAGGSLPHQHVVESVEVRPYSMMWDSNIPTSWGIWPRWSYADHADLGVKFGGPFYIIGDLPC